MRSKILLSPPPARRAVSSHHEFEQQRFTERCGCVNAATYRRALRAEALVVSVKHCRAENLPVAVPTDPQQAAISQPPPFETLTPIARRLPESASPRAKASRASDPHACPLSAPTTAIMARLLRASSAQVLRWTPCIASRAKWPAPTPRS